MMNAIKSRDERAVASAITVLRRIVLPRQDLHCSHDTIQPFVSYVHHYNQRLVSSSKANSIHTWLPGR